MSLCTASPPRSLAIKQEQSSSSVEQRGIFIDTSVVDAIARTPSRWLHNSGAGMVIRPVWSSVAGATGVEEWLASSRTWRVSSTPWVSLLAFSSYLQNMRPPEIVRDLVCMVWSTSLKGKPGSGGGWDASVEESKIWYLEHKNPINILHTFLRVMVHPLRREGNCEWMRRVDDDFF